MLLQLQPQGTNQVSIKYEDRWVREPALISWLRENPCHLRNRIPGHPPVVSYFTVDYLCK